MGLDLANNRRIDREKLSSQGLSGVAVDDGAVRLGDLAETGRGLSGAAISLLAQGVPEGTRRAYGSDRAAWAHFAEAKYSLALPVDPVLLVEYVAALLSGTSPASTRPLAATTVERRLSAISTWSQEQGYGTPDLRGARLALRGHRRSAPARPRQAAPVTVPVLRALLHEAAAGQDGPASARALRDVALISLGFALGARRSELVAVCIEDVELSADGILVRVLRRKTRDLPDRVPVPWAGDATVCAARAVVRLRIGLAARGFDQGPLFRHIRRGDNVQAAGLAPQAVADILQRVAERAEIPVTAGFGGWSGHSLRRGFATEARRAGADSLRIARHGGWADNSAALAAYLADVDRWQDHPLSGVL